MNFPDKVTILKARGVDEYGNANASWDNPSQTVVSGFLVTPTQLLLPPTAPLADGDRVRVGSRTYTADVTPARSPSKTVLLVVAVSEIGA